MRQRTKRRALSQHMQAGSQGNDVSIALNQVTAGTQQNSSNTECVGNEKQEADDGQRQYNFEYLDHTADVQLHGWGQSLEEAFAATALAMLNYQTPLRAVRRMITREIAAVGHDLYSLLYNFLDEVLFIFHTELVCCDIHVQSLDRDAWSVFAVGHGETFDARRHEQGTEVKAITYSAMQVYDGNHNKYEGCHIYAIVDI